MDLSQLEQRPLAAKKVKEGFQKTENMDLSQLQQRLLAVKKVEEG